MCKEGVNMVKPIGENVKEREVLTLIQTLQIGVESLEKKIEMLSSRLSPILAPVTSSERPKREPPRTLIGDNLMTMAVRIESISDRVDSLIMGVEI